MTSAPTSPAKICVGCKTDVTNAPRMKDPQGRYYCQSCASKAPKAAPAAKPASNVVAAVAASGDDFMSKIINEAAAKGSTTCPSCQHPISGDAKLCTACGFNLQSGKKAHTRVERVTAEKSVGSTEKASRQMPTWALWALESNSAIVLVFTVPAVITFTLALLVPELVLVHLGLAGIMYIVCCILAIKDAFEDSAGTGLSVLVSALSTIIGFFGFGYIRLGFVWIIVYGLFVTDNARLKIAWGSYLFAIVTAIYILYTNADKLFK